MINNTFKTITVFLILSVGAIATAVFAKKPSQQIGYILEHEKDIANKQPGPHDGGGLTTAFGFFSKASNCKLVFRKRILHPGASIGYHLQEANEIYYIISGAGEMKMNGKTFAVNAGDGILTLPGSSHALIQTGKDDLVVLINYEKK